MRHKPPATGKKRKIRKEIITVLCCITVFCVTYALIMPAITAQASTYCGYDKHQHTEECYKKILLCDKAEGHVHNDSCYEDGVLICTEEENHTHSDACYRKLLDCSLQEHTHTLECYSDPNADVETQDQWEDTLPEDKELDSDIRENILKITESQKNYTESDKNYQVRSDLSLNGWSRFGAFDGSSYEDWTTAYLRFVLYYSGAFDQMEEADYRLFQETEINDLLEKAVKQEKAFALSDPQPGDILFIQDDQTTTYQKNDTDKSTEDSEQVRAGFITKVDEENEKLTVSLGDWNGAVREKTYYFTDDDIWGMISLPIPEPEPEVQPETQETEADDPAASEPEETKDAEDSDEEPDETEDGSETPETKDDPDAEETDVDPEETQNESDSADDTDEDNKNIEENSESDADEDEGDADGEEPSCDQQLSARAADGTRITAQYAEGTLPEDAKLIVTHVEEGSEDYITLEEKISESLDNPEEIRLYAYDIQFALVDPYTEETTKIEPDGTVKVMMELADVPEDVQNLNRTLFHLDDDGNLEDLTEAETTVFETSEESGGSNVITFENDTFSIYGTGYTDTSSMSFQSIGSSSDWETYVCNNNGGSYFRLTSNITVYRCADISNRDVTIDLNGHSIECGFTILSISGGKTLTILNSQKISEQATPESSAGINIGNTCKVTYTNSDYSYVSDQTINIGTTTNGTNRSTWPVYDGSSLTTVSGVGVIKSTGTQAIYLDSGAKLNIEKTAVTSGTGRAINCAGNTTVNLTDTYLVQSTGGIYVGNAYGNSTLNIKGGAIADNATTDNGGGVKAVGATVNLDGKVEISNNTANAGSDNKGSGGGVYQDGGTLNITSASINNNKAKGSYSRGGGVYASGGATVNIGASGNDTDNPISISHNESNAFGGGIFLGPQQDPNQDTAPQDYASATKLFMYRGNVAHNFTNTNEGGGIHISYKSYARCVLYGGNIYGNQARNNDNWGGGGIFCSEGSYLMFPNGAAIYDNEAQGYGAGLAACTTGKIVVGNTVAMFNNTAQGSRVAGNSSKTLDSDLKKLYPNLLKNGADDFFSAGFAQVESVNANDISYKWRGTVDGTKITNWTSGVVAGKQVVALTSDTTSDEQTALKASIPLQIYDNISNIHGGGCLVNGVLVSGQNATIDYGDTLEISATKGLFNQNNEEVRVPADTFKFSLTDENWTEINEIVADKNGNLVFDEMFYYKAAGTYTYYLKEKDTGYSKYTIDSTIYKIVVTVQQTTTTTSSNILYYTTSGTALYLTEKTYKIQNIQIYSKDGSNELANWNNITSQISPSYSTDASSSSVYTPAKIDLGKVSSGNTFTDYQVDSKSIQVIKNWSDDNVNHLNDTVTVILNRTYTDASGIEVTEEAARTVLNENKDGNWTYTFINLPVQASSGSAITYSVTEEFSNRLYVSSIGEKQNLTVITLKQGDTIWVPVTSTKNSWSKGDEYLIVDPDGTVALAVKSGLNKTDSAADRWVFTELGSDDKVDLQNVGTVTIDGNTYNNVVTSQNIDTSAIFKVVEFSYNNGSGDGIGLILQNEGNTSAYLKTEKKNYTSDTVYEESSSGVQIGTGYNAAHNGRGMSVSNGNIVARSTGESSTSYIGYDYANETFVSGFGTVSGSRSVARNKAVLYTKLTVPQDMDIYSSTDTFTITNTKYTDDTAKFNLAVLKVDSDDTQKGLENAEFRLELKSGDTYTTLSFVKGDYGIYTLADSGATGSTTTLTTASDGHISVSGLAGGTYRLQETKAPVGYAPPTQDSYTEFTLTLSDDTDSFDVDTFTKTLTVENTLQPVALPESGGSGTENVMWLGIALIAASTAVLAARRRLKKDWDIS